MIAKFTKFNVSNARNYSNEKETTDTYILIGKKPGQDFKELITCRCYMGRSSQASVVYASIWVHGGRVQLKKGAEPVEIYVSGKGSAGGYGYHKSSAAIDEAIRSAGIELYGSPYAPGKTRTRRNGGQEEAIDYKRQASISGVGDSAIQDALYAIGEALHYTRKQLHISRG